MNVIRFAILSLALLLTTAFQAAAALSPVSEIAIRYLPVGAMLSWDCSDTEVTGFNIERSIDGYNFELLSRVSAEKESGDNYNYLDTDRPNELHYYRVTSFDAGGNSAASPLAAAAVPGRASWYLAGGYTVDVQQKFDFEVESQDVAMLACELHDFLGVSVARLELLVTPGPNDLSIPTADLPAGAYRLDVVGEDISQSVHFIKVAQENELFQPVVRGN